MSDNLEHPQSRAETILHDILGEDYPLEYPQSNVEKILQNMLGKNWPIDIPHSRIEKLLINVMNKGIGIPGGYTAKFKVEGEDYYIASCRSDGKITAPMDPTVSTGTFNGWKINNTAVTFPYTPSGDVDIIADIEEPGPTPSTVTITPNDWMEAGEGSWMHIVSGENLGLTAGEKLQCKVVKNGQEYNYESYDNTYIADNDENYPDGCLVSAETSVQEIQDTTQAGGNALLTVVDHCVFDFETGLSYGDGYILMIVGNRPPIADLVIFI